MPEPRPENLVLEDRELNLEDTFAIFNFFQSVTEEHLGRTYAHLKKLFSSEEKVKEYFIWLKENGAAFYGFFENKKMVGGAILIKINKKDLPTYLSEGYTVAGITHQDYSRIGLSKKVLDWAKDKVQNSPEGGGILYSNTLPTNIGAQKALVNQGFVQVGNFEGELWFKYEL